MLNDTISYEAALKYFQDRNEQPTDREFRAMQARFQDAIDESRKYDIDYCRQVGCPDREGKRYA